MFNSCACCLTALICFNSFAVSPTCWLLSLGYVKGDAMLSKVFFFHLDHKTANLIVELHIGCSDELERKQNFIETLKLLCIRKSQSRTDRLLNLCVAFRVLKMCYYQWV